MAVYSGDGNYAGSKSAVEPLTVRQATSTAATVIVDTNNNPVTSPVLPGPTIRDTATVTDTPAAFTPTGTVTYRFFTTIDGTGPYTAEIVTLNPDGTVPASALHGPLAAGPYSFVAVYSGDGNFAGSTSSVEPLAVQQGTSMTSTVIVDANHVPITSPGQVVAVSSDGRTQDERTRASIAGGSAVRVLDTASVTVTPTGIAPTGTLTYTFTGTDGTSLAGVSVSAGWAASSDHLTWTETVTLSGGKVPDSAPVTGLPGGSYEFVAQYSGDGDFRGSTSAPEPLSITGGHTGAIIEPPQTPCSQVVYDLAHGSTGESKVTVHAPVANGKIVPQITPPFFTYYVRLVAPKSSFEIDVNQSAPSPLSPLAVSNGHVTLHNSKPELIGLPRGSVTITPTDVKINVKKLTPGSVYYIGIRYSTKALVGSPWPFGPNATVLDRFQTTTLPGGLVPNSTVNLPIHGSSVEFATASRFVAFGERGKRAKGAPTSALHRSGAPGPGLGGVHTGGAPGIPARLPSRDVSLIDQAIDLLTRTRQKASPVK
jgi:hypothetical protein